MKKLYDTDEIVDLFLQGKKVKNTKWPDGRFIHIPDIIKGIIVNQDGEKFNPFAAYSPDKKVFEICEGEPCQKLEKKEPMAESGSTGGFVLANKLRTENHVPQNMNEKTEKKETPGRERPTPKIKTKETPELKEIMVAQGISREIKNEIQDMKSQNELLAKEVVREIAKEIQRLEDQGLPVREIIREIEVSKITRVEPVKKITKIVTKIDDEELEKVNKVSK